jgi:predicted amidohydrolase
MRVGFYQYRPRFGRVSRNVRKVVDMLRGADADLIVLPELAFTGYYFRDREEVLALAEDPRESAVVDSLVALCREKNFYLVTGFTERRHDKCFNSALLLGPEGLLHTYRKLHLFNEEKNWFDDGDIPLQVNTVRDARIGIMICFDWAFPEVSRVLALQGTDIICHPSNLVLAYCQQTMLSRCLENRVFAVTANRFGRDRRPHGELRFTGRSQVVAPGGEILFRATSQREVLQVISIDPGTARNKFMTELNDLLADRRPEFYAELLGGGNRQG